MSELTEIPSAADLTQIDPGLPPVSGADPSGADTITLQSQGGTCSCGCGTSSSSGEEPAVTLSPVYAIGRVEMRFPDLSAEKEFAQAVGRAETAGHTDRQVLYAVLAQRENRYLARQLCWVLSVHGMETYLLAPRDPSDLDLLVEALGSADDAISVVIGLRGPLSRPEMCNGLVVPIVAFDQIYSFVRSELIAAIPKPDNTSAAKFRPAAEELFARIMLLIDNAGATDEHRALNYLAMRYPAIYAHTAEQFARDFALTAVDVRPAPELGTRNLVDVVFTFTNRSSDFKEKVFTRVDVTGTYPFLAQQLQPYFDR